MSRLRKGNENKAQYQKRMDKQQNKRDKGKGIFNQKEKITKEEIKRIKEANIEYMKKLGIIK